MNIPTPEQFSQDLAGGEPVQLSGGITPAAGTPNPSIQPVTGGGEPAPAGGAPAAPSRKPVAMGDTSNVGDIYGQGATTQERLLQPVGGQVGKTRETIGQLGETFRQEAGPTGQTFETRGGQEAIEGYIGGNQTGQQQRQEAEDRARAFVQARYQGPTGLDQEAAGTARGRAGHLATQARALGSGYGVQSILSKAAPGLTRGQQRFEARNVLGDEGYRRAAARQQEEAQNLVGQLVGEEESARAMGEQRTTEEREIAKRARAGLLGGRTGLEADIQTRVDAENARQKAVSDAYQNFLETGDPASLLGVPGVSQDVEKLQGPGQALKKEAEAKWAEIMNDPRYADVAGFDPLGLMVSKRGREKYTLTGKPGDKVAEDPLAYLNPSAEKKKEKKKKAKDIYHQRLAGDITKDQRTMIEARQKALEDAGFAPRTSKKVKTAGKYSLVKPLYLDQEGVQLGDPRAYASLDPGMQASVENQAQGGERERFNRIQDLLDSENVMGEATEPYRQASIGAEGDRFREEEKAAFEAEAAQQQAESKKWRKGVSKARKGYKSAQKIGEFGGNFVTGLTGSETLGQAIGGLGAGMGSMDAGATARAGMNLANPMTWAKAGMESAQTGAGNAQSAGRQAVNAPGAGYQRARGGASQAAAEGKKKRKKVKV